ncbi:diacylglycerol kinase [Flavihumibacter sp. R14]|nr:diacylglycerol kinase [Flavihumibacter soli]
MAKVKLLHNAKAGDKDHSNQELIELIEAKGFSCEYASVKEKGWDKFSDDTDFLIVAGGDGTVRKVADKLLQRSLLDKRFPVAILPLGTANNLAKTLEVEETTEAAVELWQSYRKRSFDVGRVKGLEGKSFFIEAVGYGIFPSLIRRMQSSDKIKPHSPEEELELALEELRNIISSATTCYCEIEIDGADYSGDYLMVEILNIKSIGPNLFLGPDAEVDDGVFDVLLLPEGHRDEFQDHISDKLKGHQVNPALMIIQGKQIKLKWHGSDCHIDDERMELPELLEIIIEVQPQALEFLVP